MAQAQVTISLNRAHKISGRITDYLRVVERNIRSAITPVSVSAKNYQIPFTPSNGILEGEMGLHNNLLVDKMMLRKAIGLANSKNGIDDLLTEKSLINVKLSMLQRTVIEIGEETSEFSQAAAQIQALIDGATSQVDIIRISLLASQIENAKDVKNAIQAEIVTLEHRQFQIDDLISEKNRDTITVELTDYTIARFVNVTQAAVQPEQAE